MRPQCHTDSSVLYNDEFDPHYETVKTNEKETTNPKIYNPQRNGGVSTRVLHTAESTTTSQGLMRHMGSSCVPAARQRCTLSLGQKAALVGGGLSEL